MSLSLAVLILSAQGFSESPYGGAWPLVCWTRNCLLFFLFLASLFIFITTLCSPHIPDRAASGRNTRQESCSLLWEKRFCPKGFVNKEARQMNNTSHCHGISDEGCTHKPESRLPICQVNSKQKHFSSIGEIPERHLSGEQPRMSSQRVSFLHQRMKHT